MAVIALFVILGSLGGAYWVASEKPTRGKQVLFGRKLLTGIAALVFALLLITTQSPQLMLVGGLMLFLFFLWVFLNDPQEGIA